MKLVAHPKDFLPQRPAPVALKSQTIPSYESLSSHFGYLEMGDGLTIGLVKRQQRKICKYGWKVQGVDDFVVIHRSSCLDDITSNQHGIGRMQCHNMKEREMEAYLGSFKER